MLYCRSERFPYSSASAQVVDMEKRQAKGITVSGSDFESKRFALHDFSYVLQSVCTNRKRIAWSD